MNWTLSFLKNMDHKLMDVGIGNRAQKNKFCVVVFGRRAHQHKSPVAPDHLLDAMGEDCVGSHEVAGLFRKEPFDGSYEDGYWAIKYALDRYGNRLGGAAGSLLLVTDEDVDSGHLNLTRPKIKNMLKKSGFSFDVIVDNEFSFCCDKRFGNEKISALGKAADEKTSLVIANGELS